MTRWLAVLMAVAATSVNAQPSGILLVAKPDLADPNFREAVIVVTRAPDASTVGVILNRPTTNRYPKFPEPLYAGGPVMREVVVALFAADEPPKDAAFEVLPHVYLSMHPRVIDSLAARPGRPVRFFAGCAGWVPRQLKGGRAQAAGCALPASQAMLFPKIPPYSLGRGASQAPCAISASSCRG